MEQAKDKRQQQLAYKFLAENYDRQPDGTLKRKINLVPYTITIKNGILEHTQSRMPTPLERRLFENLLINEARTLTRLGLGPDRW